MKKRNLILNAALVAAFGATAGSSWAAATIGATVRDFALETCQNGLTKFTQANAVYTEGVPINQDFYVTFFLGNGLFSAAPVATATNGTATLVDGGTVGSSNVTYRVNASSVPNLAGDKVTLSNIQTTATSCAAPVTVNATNGLLFISGANASPVEVVTGGPNSMATFTQAVVLTMAADTDPIDLNPASPTASRTVFGPATYPLDAGESATRLTRQIAIAIGPQLQPNGVNTMDNTIDSLTIALSGILDLSGIANMCFDANKNAVCDAGENMVAGTVTIANGAWSAGANAPIILDKTVGAVFTPRTFNVTSTLNVATHAFRPGMTAHTFGDTPVANTSWPIVYANGTLLRSSWFTVDPSTNTTATLRLENAGTVSSAAVVQATAYLDSGVTNAFAVADIPVQQGRNIPLTTGLLPGMTAGAPGNRGFLEVVIAGDLANVDGAVITYQSTTGNRTITPMRNVTIDTGNRTAAPY